MTMFWTKSLRRILTMIGASAMVWALGAIFAPLAFASYGYYGAKNYSVSGPIDVRAYQYHVLTGNQANNGSCNNNNPGACGVYLCTYALTTSNHEWGPTNCAYDGIYHSFQNVNLDSVMQLNACCSQYIYGTMFW